VSERALRVVLAVIAGYHVVTGGMALVAGSGLGLVLASRRAG